MVALDRTERSDASMLLLCFTSTAASDGVVPLGRSSFVVLYGEAGGDLCEDAPTCGIGASLVMESDRALPLSLHVGHSAMG